MLILNGRFLLLWKDGVMAEKENDPYVAREGIESPSLDVLGRNLREQAIQLFS